MLEQKTVLDSIILKITKVLGFLFRSQGQRPKYVFLIVSQYHSWLSHPSDLSSNIFYNSPFLITWSNVNFTTVILSHPSLLFLELVSKKNK